jgi:thiaminase/transcriptional activator TenA
MAISEELRSECADIWERQHRHPFVTGIGDGTLDVNRFRFWVRQDYLFLIEYGRVLAFAAARAPDLASMSRFAELTHSTLTTEMDLHRSFCGELGISRADLEAERMARTTRGYTDFLVRVAAQADFALVLAALLPCMWGYSEIGQRLAGRGPPGGSSLCGVDRDVRLRRIRGTGSVVSRDRGRGRRGRGREDARGDGPDLQDLE